MGVFWPTSDSKELEIGAHALDFGSWNVSTHPTKDRILGHTPKSYPRKKSQGNMLTHADIAEHQTRPRSQYEKYIVIYEEPAIEVNIDIDFIVKIDSLYQSNDRDKGVEYIYQYFGDLIIKRDFERCNRIIELLIDKEYATWILLPFLTLTKPYKKEIISRAELFGDAVLKFTETLTMEQLQATIKRLK